MVIGYTPPRIVDDNGSGAEVRGIDEQELESLIGAEIARAQLASGDGESDKRARELDYYNGRMPDFPHKKGRSSYTSRETSDTIGWILPGLMRVFAGSMRSVNFLPQGPGDEANAEQASDYINYQFYNKNDGYKVLRDASFDALLHGYGVVKQYWDEYPKTETRRVTGVTEEELAILEQDGCEILDVRPSDQEPWLDPAEVQAFQEQMQAAQQPPQEGQPPQPPMEMPQEPQPHELFDAKVVHRSKSGHICYKVVAGEDFIRDPQATCIDDARFLGQREEKTRSELVEMGFDVGKVYELPAYSGIGLNDVKLSRDDDDDILGDASVHASMEKVELFEVFIKVDVDGDGIAESVRAYFAGGSGGAGQLLFWEEWEDEWPFDIVPCNPMSHRFDGRSTASDVEDIQQINTILARGLFDNLYANNVPMMMAEEGSVLNPEMLQSPKFGGTLFLKKGSMSSGAEVKPFAIPFVGDKIVEAMEFTANLVEKRTGVSRTTMALDPSAYQDQTATAAQLQTQASYAKLELIARDMAELGWKKIFKKSLKILVSHQDRKEMIRLRDKWVEMDPSWWNADMDCQVNVGLGTGSAEKDAMSLGQIYQLQLQTTQILENSGDIEAATAMVPKIVRTATRIAQTSGIRDAAGYFPDITEKDVPRLVQSQQEKSSQPPLEIQLEQLKQQGAQQLEQIRAQTTLQTRTAELQAEAAAEQQRLQMEQQAKFAELDATLRKELASEQAKMQAEANKELAQLQADLQTKEAERQSKLEIEDLKAETEAWKTKVVEANKWDIAVLQAQVTAATTEANNETKEGVAQTNAKAKKVNVSSDGKVTDKDDDRHRESTELLKAIKDAMSQPPKPRKTRIIRDKDGRIDRAEDYD